MRVDETLADYLHKIKTFAKVLLKIDVQGYEHKVLQGGLKVLEQVDFVLVETSFRILYENQASFHDVYRILTAHGFEYAGSLDQLLSSLDGTILQCEALFMRKL